MDFDDLDELEESGAGDILRTVAAQDVAWQSFQKRRKEEERCHQDRLEELRRRRLMEEQLQRERERERQDREYEEFLRRKQQEAELWRRQHEAWGAEGSPEEEGLQEAPPCDGDVEEEVVEEEGDADEAELLRRLELEDSERLACRQREELQARQRAEPPPPPSPRGGDAAAAAAVAAGLEEEEEGDRQGAWEAMAERQRARKERQRLKARQAQEEPTNHEPSLHFDPYTSFCQRLMAKTRNLNDMEREYEDLRRPTREPEPAPEGVEVEDEQEEGQLQIEAVPVLQSVLALIDREEERDRDFQEFRHCLPDLGSGGESAAAAAEEEEELPNPYLAASVKAFEGKAHGVDLTSVMGLHFEAARKAAKLPELEADYTERLEEKQRRLQEKEREAKEAARRGLARKVEASLARDLKRPILGAAPKNAKIVASDALWQGSSAAAGSELGSWGGKHFAQSAPAARSAGSDRLPPGAAAPAASKGHWTAGDGGWGGSSSSASAAPRLVPERPVPKGRLAALRGGGGQAGAGRAAKPAADAGGPGAPKKPPGGPALSAPGGPAAAAAGPPHAAAAAAAASPAVVVRPRAEAEAGGPGAARVERRKAPDGRCYTREQFLEFYSGLAQWEAAPARAEAAASAEDLE